jgi:hypothetical protein
MRLQIGYRAASAQPVRRGSVSGAAPAPVCAALSFCPAATASRNLRLGGWSSYGARHAELGGVLGPVMCQVPQLLYSNMSTARDVLHGRTPSHARALPACALTARLLTRSCWRRCSCRPSSWRPACRMGQQARRRAQHAAASLAAPARRAVQRRPPKPTPRARAPTARLGRRARRALPRRSASRRPYRP